MIAAWMIYSLLVGALLYAAARAAEVVCRAVGAPARLAWALALCTTLGLSANALRSAAARAASETPPRSIAHETSKIVASAGSAVAAPVIRQSRWLAAVQSGRSAFQTFGKVLDPNALTGATRFDRALGIAAVLCGSAAICYLALMLGHLRRVARGCQTRELDGHRILVSDDIGPALIGIIRPRVVVPRWVLSLSEADRRGILAHELEHASAGDPALLSAAWLLVALLPWNAGIWGMFARLRLSIEADCDARVLRTHGDARRYGSLLLMVYERTIATRTPRVAFVERRSHLEERVRRLARRAPRLRSPRGIATMMAALMLAAVACEVTTPSRTALDSAAALGARNREQSTMVVGDVPRCLRWDMSKQGDAPSFEDLKAWARARRPKAMSVGQGRDGLVGLLLDENCEIVRDTLVSVPTADRVGWPDRFLVDVFGDTMDFARPRGMLFDYPNSHDRSQLATIVWGVKPSAEWRARLAGDQCGFGIRSNEVCSIQGPLEIRMLDSVRALIAVRRFRASNQPVDHLFLVTLAHPNSALRSQSMVHSVVAFQSGAVYVEDFQARHPRWLFAPSTTNGLANQRHLPDVQMLRDLVGVAHYTGVRLTLEQVRQLLPAPSCDGPKGSCYEVDGQSIRFPA